MLRKLRWPLTFLITMALSLKAGAASAQAPAVPILTPLNMPKEVRLNALAVDIKLKPDFSAFDLSASYRFENTSKLDAKTFSVQVKGGESAGNFALKYGGRDVSPLSPVEITLEPSSKGILTLQGTLPLTGYPLIGLSYPLPKDFASKGVDSIRVTVHFPSLFRQEEVVQAEPKGFEFDGFRLTWRWIEEPFPSEVKLSLPVPPLREKLGELRGKTDAQSLYEVGTIYRTLAMALPPDSEAFERFYREAIACLEKARLLDPNLYQASLDLAALYHYRAYLPNGSLDLPTLALAGQELEKAIKAGASERNLAWTLQSIYLTLSQELQREGLYREAIAYIEKASALADKGFPVPVGKGEVGRLKRDLSALLAIKLLEEGEAHEAISIVNEALGRDFWEVLGLKLPICRTTKALVRIKPRVGEIECSCLLSPLYNPSDPDLASLPSPVGERLLISLSFPLGKEHAPERKEMAERFPTRAELALCFAPLKSSEIEWSERTEFWAKRYFVEGEIDTSEAHSLLEVELANWRRRENELASGKVFESDALQRLGLELIKRGEAELAAFSGNSSLELELRIGGSGQIWFVKPGGKIAFQREFQELYPWVKPMVFLLAVTAAALVIVLLWRAKALA